jgi:HAD superfamily hydrolase (TIGR01549 family)
MLKAIFLDFGNTLVDESIFIPAAQMGIVRFVRDSIESNEDEATLYEKFKKTDSGLPSDHILRKNIRDNELFPRMCKYKNFAAACGLDLDEKGLAEMMRAYDNAAAEAGLIEGTVKTLTTLQKKYKLAIVSNGYGGFVRETLRRHNLQRFFDVIVVSQEVNIQKPDMKMYASVAEMMDVKLDEVLMAGDGFEPDIAGPKQLGMKTCWINPEQKPAPVPDMCDFIVSTLAELPEKLNGNIK